MESKRSNRAAVAVLLALMLAVCSLVSCSTGSAGDVSSVGSADVSNADSLADEDAVTYEYEEVPLKRRGIKLHLDRMWVNSACKNILLIHGVTYSSHEFDINYQDYSLVRALAREGYNVWRLDIAGFGQSGEVKNGFKPDSDYAAEDINAAVEKIVDVTGQDKIDVLGWSWGTVTVGRFAAKHGRHVNKVVLYAPIVSGIGDFEVAEPFHKNTWEHAADDFQKTGDGGFDYSVADPVVIEMFCSSCWHYDGESSPNGGRRDICVPETEKLFDMAAIKAPTLLIYGDSDPYLNYEMIEAERSKLPAGSSVEVIRGGSHVVCIEKPYYHEFQQKLFGFLAG